MPEIVMSIPSLDAVPRKPFPTDFTLRGYQPGDRDTWTHIHERTGYYDPMPTDLFEREFGHDDAALKERQLFVIDEDGGAVATATAWFPQADRDPNAGRIHWVAVDPAVQRQGIASALLGAVCDRFAELGYTSAYLTTDRDNQKAIALYESLNFRQEGESGQR